ncbi:unnamed protein product [Acanthosepion pharaonis]|uniref:Uncharacterized protein n=1 Tax=Acanthosepion pharaonis TaxID=158019 RepID=A0A812E0J1_ACAPH|nr:unnamed protein product [Sepia pharaonis]
MYPFVLPFYTLLAFYTPLHILTLYFNFLSSPFFTSPSSFLSSHSSFLFSLSWLFHSSSLFNLILQLFILAFFSLSLLLLLTSPSSFSSFLTSLLILFLFCHLLRLLLQRMLTSFSLILACSDKLTSIRTTVRTSHLAIMFRRDVVSSGMTPHDICLSVYLSIKADSLS